MQSPLDPTNFTQVNYTFQTLTTEPKDTAAHGIGRNHRWTGMIRTLFMPSDDSTRLPYASLPPSLPLSLAARGPPCILASASFPAEQQLSIALHRRNRY
jgi:hypothetical protein